MDGRLVEDIELSEVAGDLLSMASPAPRNVPKLVTDDRRPKTDHRPLARLLRDLEYHLPRLSRLDRADGLVGSFEREAMRDHWRRVELAGAEKARHLVPRVVHAPADDAVDRDSLE